MALTIFPFTFPADFVGQQNIGGSLTVTAARTGSAQLRNRAIGGSLTVTAAPAGSVQAAVLPSQSNLPGTLPMLLGRRAAQDRSIGGTLTVTAGRSGNTQLLRINPPLSAASTPWSGLPANQLLDINQVVSLRTIDGIQLHQFGPTEYTTLRWGRELRDVSSCEITLPPLLDMNSQLPEIVPWLHWISVYSVDARMLLWDGPIQKLSSTRDSATITAKDIGALMTRTRTPLTKRWDSQDVSVPAGELWAAMIAHHNLPTKAIVRPDPQSDGFDFNVRGDEKMMDGPIGDLVNLGLRWTVVAGVPIIGPVSRQPVAELGENDFIGGGVQLIRDGSQFFNDVLLRGPDSLARTRVERYGLNLQTIVDVDSMFGVSNVERATGAYARYVSDVRDSVGLADGSVLHPDAPITLEELIPSARFTLAAYGLRSKQELESMSVTLSSGKAEVAIKLESVVDKDDLPELADLVADKSQVSV